MPLIAELLKEASTRTQLIVATHSPLLVDHLGKEHICVTELDEDGATTIKRATEMDIDNWMKDFTLGDLWLQGHLGGNPW